MILSDSSIKKAMNAGQIVIGNFNPDHMNPNSYDVTLAPELKVYPRDIITVEYFDEIPDWAVAYNQFTQVYNGYSYERPLDPRKKPEIISLTIPEEGYVLVPGEVYLYACAEEIGVKGNICAQVQAKSSLGRLGLDIVVGPAGFIDSGFQGSLVLELRATRPIIVYPGMKIAQIKFELVEGEILESYDVKPGSKYHGQKGVQESKYYENHVKVVTSVE